MDGGLCPVPPNLVFSYLTAGYQWRPNGECRLLPLIQQQQVAQEGTFLPAGTMLSGTKF